MRSSHAALGVDDRFLLRRKVRIGQTRYMGEHRQRNVDRSEEPRQGRQTISGELRKRIGR
jgi:hypothetical protein